MASLFMIMIRKFGYPTARRMASKFGISPGVVQDVQRGITTGPQALAARGMMPPGSGGGAAATLIASMMAAKALSDQQGGNRGGYNV